MSIELIQGSDEWRAARVGKVTGSCIHQVVAKTKNGWGAERAKYMYQLLCERISGRATEGYVTWQMRQGTEREPEARITYELIAGVDVQQVGFVPHPRIAMSGSSPDGLVNDDGIIEIKCPEVHTHIKTLETESIDGDYWKQMQWNLATTERKWCDFISFNPEPHVPEPLRFWKRRVFRDDKLIAELEKEVPVFIAELDEKVAKLQSKYNLKELEPELVD